MSEWKKLLGAAAAGTGAGAVNGLFGGAGGMILLPGLRRLAGVADACLFPTSVAVMLPTCLVSLGLTAAAGPLPVREALPWMLGSALGGAAAGLQGKRIPLPWLHRFFGCILIAGGVRGLWQSLLG